jgi:hypothetical protein
MSAPRLNKNQNRRNIMRSIGSIILLIMGIVFLATGIFTYFVINTAFGSIPAEANELGLGQMESLFQFGISAVFGGLGALLTLFGALGLIRGSKKAKQDNLIAQTGLEKEATVTFVDKNYNLLVNNRPIYSIVEYKYQDDFGNEYTNRVKNANTNDVIRQKIEVGSTIRIKYLPHDPAQSVIAV